MIQLQKVKIHCNDWENSVLRVKERERPRLKAPHPESAWFARELRLIPGGLPR